MATASAKQEAQRHCMYCGKVLVRKRQKYGLETLSKFRQRRYCDRSCVRNSMNGSVKTVTTDRHIPEHLLPAFALFVMCVRNKAQVDGKLAKSLARASTHVRFKTADEEARQIAWQSAGLGMR